MRMGVPSPASLSGLTIWCCRQAATKVGLGLAWLWLWLWLWVAVKLSVGQDVTPVSVLSSFWECWKTHFWVPFGPRTQPSPLLPHLLRDWMKSMSIPRAAVQTGRWEKGHLRSAAPVMGSCTSRNKAEVRGGGTFWGAGAIALSSSLLGDKVLSHFLSFLFLLFFFFLMSYLVL